MSLFLHDSADKTPPRPAGEPPHRTISGADFERATQPPLVAYLPWPAWVVLGVVVLTIVGLVVWWVVRWAARNPELAELGQVLLMTLLFVVVLAGAAWVIVALYFSLMARYGQALATLFGRSRLGNLQPLHTMAAQSLRDVAAFEHAAIGMQTTIAPHQQYPLLSTLSEGNHEEAHTEINGIADEVAPALPPPNVPILDHLRSQGHIWRSGNSIMVGYDETTTPHYIDIANAPVIGVAGASQYGKSSFVRFALAQLAAQPGPEPAAIVMCDPHGAINDRSLAVSCKALERAYLMPVATDPETILQSVRQTAQLAQARLDGRDTSKHHIVLVIDEFTALMNRGGEYATEMVKLLRRFGNEFGKVWCTTFLIGQSWNSDLAGGTALRNAIQAMVVYGCKRQQAAFLLGSEEGKLAETLAKGTGDALFKPHWADDLRRVRVPWVSAGDLEGLSVRAAPPLMQQAAPAVDSHAKLRAGIRALDPAKRAAALRRFATMRDTATRTGWKYTTDELRDLFGMNQNELVAIVGVLRNGRDSGLRQNSATVATIDPL